MKAFLGRLKVLEDKVNRLPAALLTEVADVLVNSSPDDTGAYILSHSIGQSGAVGRQISSHGRPQAPNTHRDDARAGLYAQAAAISPETTRVWVGNNAPHATQVEFGGSPWRTSGYFVYAKLAQQWPALIVTAKNKVGLQ
jgi:hypothetical protein